ncbi:ser-thr- gpi-anchored family, partial [Fusarium acutatum]
VPTQSAGQPPVYGQPTPTPVPVSGAARFGAPIAVVAGLVMAAFAL